MNKNEAIQIAKSLFENHTVNEFFIAKDGQAFFTEVSATNHQQSFKTEEKVILVTREEAAADQPETSEADTEGETVIDEATGAEVPKKKAPAKKK